MPNGGGLAAPAGSIQSSYTVGDAFSVQLVTILASKWRLMPTATLTWRNGPFLLG